MRIFKSEMNSNTARKNIENWDSFQNVEKIKWEIESIKLLIY